MSNELITQIDAEILKSILKSNIDSLLLDMKNGRLEPSVCDDLKRKIEALKRVDATIQAFRNGCDVILQDQIMSEADTDVEVTRVVYRNVQGAGKQLFADMSWKQNCTEFTLKQGLQPVIQTDALVGYEPWIQFDPSERDKIMDTLFTQLASAWNEKYGVGKSK